MSARTFAVFIGVTAILALLIYGLTTQGEGRLALGDAVPSRELGVLGDQGATGSLADHRGKWVLVNVWAEWCGPCKEEAPALEAFYRQHGGERFEMLGIDTKDTSDRALGFVKENGLTYPQLDDPGDYAEDLKTTGVPESFLVDPEGNLAASIPGAVTDSWLAHEVAPRIEGS